MSRPFLAWARVRTLTALVLGAIALGLLPRERYAGISAADGGQDAAAQGSTSSTGKQKRKGWPRVTILAGLALICAAASWGVRAQDSQTSIPANDVKPEPLALYVDPETPFTTWPTLGSPDGPIRIAWRVNVHPGQNTRAELALVEFEHKYKELVFDKPATVLFAVPEGAALLPSTLRVGFPKSCATWNDGSAVYGVEPEFIDSADAGPEYIRCTIPSVGRVKDLFVDIEVEWPSTSRTPYGFARTQYAFKRTFNPVGDVPDEMYTFVPPPVDYEVHIQAGETLPVASSSPDLIRLQSQTWYSDRDFEFAFTIERPRDRLWVAPAVDILLLAAGVLFGLLPWAASRHG